MKTPSKIQVDRRSAAEDFTYAAEIIKLQPAHVTDQPIIRGCSGSGSSPA
jgi:hypothetical protein